MEQRLVNLTVNKDVRVNTYRFQPDALKAWLEKQAASGDKDARQNDSTAEGGQKGK